MKNSLKFATMLVAAQISISPINIYAVRTRGAEGNLDSNGGWTGWNVGDNAGWDDLLADQTSDSPQIKALKFDDDTPDNATLPTGYDGIIIPGIINTRDDKATLLIQSGIDTAPVSLGPVKDQNNAGLEIKLEDNKHVNLINRYEARHSSIDAGDFKDSTFNLLGDNTQLNIRSANLLFGNIDGKGSVDFSGSKVSLYGEIRAQAITGYNINLLDDNIPKNSSLIAATYDENNDITAIGNIASARSNTLYIYLQNKYSNTITGNFSGISNASFRVNENSYIRNSKILTGNFNPTVKKTLIIENDGSNGDENYSGEMNFNLYPQSGSSEYSEYKDVAYIPSLFDYKTQLVDEYSKLPDENYTNYDSIINNLKKFTNDISGRSTAMDTLNTALSNANAVDGEGAEDIKNKLTDILDSIDAVFNASVHRNSLHPSILVSRNTNTTTTNTDIEGIGDTARQLPVKITADIGATNKFFTYVKLEGDHELRNNITARRIELDNSKFDVNPDFVLGTPTPPTVTFNSTQTIIDNSIIDITNNKWLLVSGELILKNDPYILMNANSAIPGLITYTGSTINSADLNSLNFILSKTDTLELNNFHLLPVFDAGIFEHGNETVDLRNKLKVTLYDDSSNKYDISSLFAKSFVDLTATEDDIKNVNTIATSGIIDNNAYAIANAATLNTLSNIKVIQSLVMENSAASDLTKDIIPASNSTGDSGLEFDYDELLYLKNKIAMLESDESSSDNAKIASYKSYLDLMNSILQDNEIAIDDTTINALVSTTLDYWTSGTTSKPLAELQTDIKNNIITPINTAIQNVQFDGQSFISKNIAAESNSNNLQINDIEINRDDVAIPLQESKVILHNSIGTEDLQFSRVKLEGDHELRNNIYARRIELDNSKFDVNPDVDDGATVTFNSTQTIIDNSIIDIKDGKQLVVSGELILKNDPYILMNANSGTAGILLNDDVTLDTTQLGTLNILLRKTNPAVGDAINLIQLNPALDTTDIISKLNIVLYGDDGAIYGMSNAFIDRNVIWTTVDGILVIPPTAELEGGDADGDAGDNTPRLAFNNTPEQNAAILEESLGDLIDGTGQSNSSSKNSAISKENIKILANVNSLMNKLAKLPKEKQAKAVARLLTSAEDTIATMSASNLIQINNRLETITAPVPTEVASGDNTSLNKKGFWAKPFYSKTKQDNIDTKLGYNMKSSGISVGFDKELHNKSLLGAGVTILKSNAKYNQPREGDETKIKTYLGTIYGALTFDNNIFAQGVLSAGINNTQNNMSRIDVSDSAIEESNYDVKILTAQVNLGKNFMREKSIITPNIGVNYEHTDTPKYTSKVIAPGDNSDLNMLSERRKVNQLYGSASVKFAGKGIVMSNHENFTPEVKVKLTKNFGETSDDIKRRLEGANDNFATPAKSEDKNITYNIGLGGHVDNGKKAQYGIEYNVLGSKGFSSHQVALSLKMIF